MAFLTYLTFFVSHWSIFCCAVWIYNLQRFGVQQSEFRNFTRLAIFSGCLSVMSLKGTSRAQRCKLWIISPPSLFVLNGIFLGFWTEEFFSATLHIFSKFWPIKNSLTYTAIEHIFEFLERGFHCEYFMFCKFVDLMFRTW